MLARWGLLGAVLAAGSALSSPASAADCVPARLAEASVTLPQAWRVALEALAAATVREGQPWSCADAQIALIPPGDQGLAQLEVTDASGVRRRSVASPADVVPLGEAMLARMFPPQAAPPPPPPLPLLPPPLNPPVDDGGLARPFAVLPPPKLAVDDGGLSRSSGGGLKPRGERERGSNDVLLDLLVGARYTGPTKALLVGPELRATLGFDRWFAGLIARYDSARAVFQTVPDQFTLSSVTIGLAAGYRLLTAPVELSLAVEPTMGVTLMGDQRPNETEPDIDSQVDMRLGARFAAAVPVTERLRVVGALGAEGVPAALFSDRHSHRHELPSLPGYLAGFSLGMELLAIR